MIGIANLTDLDNTMYTIKPAKKHAKATRVPD